MNRTPVYCDCHGTQVMGYMVDGRYIHYDKRHGETHTVKVEVDKLSKECKTLAK